MKHFCSLCGRVKSRNGTICIKCRRVRIKAKCLVCGNGFEHRPSRPKVTCSNQCSHKLIASKNIGPRKTLEEKFWSKVNIQGDDECWLWTGAKWGNGYGLLCLNPSSLLAHRLSWELHYGLVPDGLLVLHKCDVRNCINPKHLYVGTHIDNTRDRVERNRSSRSIGERSGKSKLKSGEVWLIRRLLGAKFSIRSIAKLFKISSNVIWGIKSGKRWPGVELA
jgi:hypothetical protein